MNCLLSIDWIDDLATTGAFGPHAWFPASRFIVDDRVLSSDRLAAERAGATDCFWVIRSHSHEFAGYFEGRGSV